MNTDNNILNQIEIFVKKYFKDKHQVAFTYHNIDHTQAVVSATIKIAAACKLNNSDTEMIIIAAWFHDIGYFTNKEEHEKESIRIAEEYLNSQKYSIESIKKIGNCIYSTKMGVEPKNILEQVLCDADLFALGEKNNFKNCSNLRKEQEIVFGKTLTYKKWLKQEIDFLEKHQYYTSFAREQQREQKENNLTIIKNLLMQEPTEPKKEKKKTTLSKGVETMFRITSRNHTALSAMADDKANIMLSINAIIISLSMSLLLPNILTTPKLLIPTSILLLVSILTIIFATLATRPKVTSGTFTKEDIHNKRVNLLFFGNFFKVDFEDFDWGMKEMMKDNDFLYGSLIKDFYYLGIVLNQKFKYLRYCYNTFMFGMIIATLVFILTLAIDF